MASFQRPAVSFDTFTQLSFPG